VRILAVNWLDLDNPQAGGAEVHFFEIFRRIVDAGHEVDLIASGWRGAPRRVRLRGLAVRRVAGRHSFTLRGRAAVRAALRATRYDVVVEDVNKLPLYLPTLTRLPTYVIVPHLFGTTAFAEAPWPLAAIVWVAERPVPWLYRSAAFHAISDSTRDDLVSRGVPPDRIRVVYPGVDSRWYCPDAADGRARDPTFLYVGRLKRYKGVATAVHALALARRNGKAFRLLVAGQGDDRARLERVAATAGVRDAVQFLGFVSDEEKRTLMRRAWAVVLPSAKEGWGITNIEAAACGTPAIVSDSPGLRESVRHEQSGLLVPHANPAALAAAMTRLAESPDLVGRFGRGARAFAETLSWDDAAHLTLAHLEDTIHDARRNRKE